MTHTHALAEMQLNESAHAGLQRKCCVSVRVCCIAMQGGDEEGPEEADEGVLGGGDDRDEQAVAAAAAARAELNRLLEEYYKLDYEGVAGGLKTRYAHTLTHLNTDTHTRGLCSAALFAPQLQNFLG